MIIEIGIAIKTITRTTLLQGRAQMNVRNCDHVKKDFDDSYRNEALEYKPTDSYMKEIQVINVILTDLRLPRIGYTIS